jgi:hypothetical protein
MNEISFDDQLANALNGLAAAADVLPSQKKLAKQARLKQQKANRVAEAAEVEARSTAIETQRLADEETRAINAALMRQRLAREVLNGLFAPSSTSTNHGEHYYDTDYNEDEQEYSDDENNHGEDDHDYY